MYRQLARILARHRPFERRTLSASVGSQDAKALDSDLRAPSHQEFAAFHAKLGYLIDMDGVLYHGGRLLPGAKSFIEWLKANNKKFLFLTNSSERSPRELRDKLLRLGIDVPDTHFYTSALATAAFLASQRPNGTAYVIGEAALTGALYDVGFAMNDHDPGTRCGPRRRRAIVGRDE